MAAYKPIKVLGPKTGLVTEREDFLLPDDAYTEIVNAYTRLQKLKKKETPGLLGRLRRVFTSQAMGNTTNVTTQTINIFSALVPPIVGGHPEIEPGSVTINVNAGMSTFSDATTLNGSLIATGTGVSAGSSINYSTGDATLVFSPAPGVVAITITFSYFPGLPVMGLLSREIDSESRQQVIAFDTVYAYRFTGGEWSELPSTTPTTWNGSDSDFFWSTNWSNDPITNKKIFWVTNFTGPTGTPIRYYNNVTWTDFTPAIDNAGNVLAQSRILLPFRGRLLALNTYEGANLGASTNYPQRIRWSQIGSPFLADSWNDITPGKGGFLDIPTAEFIISAGFVRDNLVIFCERSTWQLRYTGQAVAPFQIEKVNTELGCKGPFSTIPFDTELVTVGSRGIISCDSFSAKRIDEKILNFAFDYANNDFNGDLRINGIRDFVLRLAYWTYPNADTDSVYPDRMLVYNYEEDSWFIFNESYTCFGQMYENNDITWAQAKIMWSEADFTWRYVQSTFPIIIAGNQEGFVMQLTRPNQPNQSLAISAINGAVSPMVLTIYNHNLQSDDVIRISDIPTGTAFATTLNNKVFGVERLTADTISIQSYSSVTKQFSVDVPSEAGTYVGYGRAAPVENFSITSKKFNFIDEGQQIQLGFIDILTEKTESGEFTVNVYTNYADNTISNDGSDSFFNTIVSTSDGTNQQTGQSKLWQRIQCPNRASFVQTQFTLSPTQLNSGKDLDDVQIDAQILWVRPAGTVLNN